MFERDMSGCARLDLESWKRRGVWQRAQELLAAFLEEQV
jgi:hypothetical protein